MAAGLATLQQCDRPDFYPTLEAKAARLAKGLEKAAAAAGVPVTVNRVGSMLTPFFVPEKGAKVRDFVEATRSDTKRFGKFFASMLEQGVYLPPSQYEAWFVGWTHEDRDIDQTIKAAKKAFEACLS
jgi:glutamate-1-semialdehyde 2,1-aminomutase